MAPRKPLTLRTTDLGPAVPPPNEVQSNIERLQKKLGYKPKKKVMPKAPSETAPGKETNLA